MRESWDNETITIEAKGAKRLLKKEMDIVSNGATEDKKIDASPLQVKAGLPEQG